MSRVIIVGGGIVGVSTAFQLINMDSNIEVCIIEKEGSLAYHQTGRNSGVIHSGIYYKPGSFKAQNCRRGYEMLLSFCDEHQIPYELCGKVIVATDKSQLPALDKLYERGVENGLKGLEWLDEAGIKKKEPHTTGIKGIYVPQTGIVAYKRVTEKMAELLGENPKVEIKLNEAVTGFKTNDGNIEVETQKGSYTADKVINCAGLYCDKIAERAGETLDVRIIPFRGEYFTIKPEKSHLVKSLIYPVPDANFPFLGVHFTRRVTGEIEAGPNAVFAFRREGYNKWSVNVKELFESLFWRGFQKVAFKYASTGMGEFYRSYSKSAFTRALQKLVPEIQKEDLNVAPSGVRAQACHRNGDLIDDFYIMDNERFIHVLNAPSPAATSSLAIGETVAKLIVNG